MPLVSFFVRRCSHIEMAFFKWPARDYIIHHVCRFAALLVSWLICLYYCDLLGFLSGFSITAPVRMLDWPIWSLPLSTAYHQVLCIRPCLTLKLDIYSFSYSSNSTEINSHLFLNLPFYQFHLSNVIDKNFFFFTFMQERMMDDHMLRYK